MSSLDTNLVLRLILQDHIAQSPAVAALVEGGRKGEFVIEDAVIFECVWIMQGASYGFDRRLIADLISEVNRIEQVSCNKAMLSRVLPLYIHHPSLSFVDISLAVYADLNDALPLLTYDKKLAKSLPELVQLVA